MVLLRGVSFYLALMALVLFGLSRFPMAGSP